MTKTIPMTITRGQNDYEIEVRATLEKIEEVPGSVINAGGWCVSDYDIVSTELSGIETLTDIELEVLCEEFGA